MNSHLFAGFKKKRLRKTEAVFFKMPIKRTDYLMTRALGLTKMPSES